MKNLNTETEIKRVASGDKRRGHNLVAVTFQAELLQRARAIMRDHAEANDVVQEVFIRAMRETRLFDNDFRIRAWLYRVTTNLCFNTLRNRKRRGAILQSIQLPKSVEPVQVTRLLAQERTSSVTTAIKTLNVIHQEVLVLRFYMDLSYAEIATRLEICVGTVMSRLSRAKRQLNQVLTAPVTV